MISEIIKTEMGSDSFTIIANKHGLLALAEMLTNMANDDELFDGWHQHLDAGMQLETGSVELILMKDNSVAEIKVARTAEELEKVKASYKKIRDGLQAKMIAQ